MARPGFLECNREWLTVCAEDAECGDGHSSHDRALLDIRYVALLSENIEVEFISFSWEWKFTGSWTAHSQDSGGRYSGFVGRQTFHHTVQWAQSGNVTVYHLKRERSCDCG